MTERYMKPWASDPHGLRRYRGAADRGWEPFGDPAHAEGVTERLRRTAERIPHAAAAVDADGRLTFLGLWNAAIAVALQINRQDSKRGPVAILLTGDRHYLVAMHACLAAGRMAVLMDASFPDARNLSMMENAKVDLVLRRGNPPAEWPALPYLDPTAWVAQALAAPAEVPSTFEQRLATDAPALTLATSGSSGNPKLIVHSQRTMWHLARTAHEAMRVTVQDRALTLSSLASLGGLSAMFGLPLGGASVHFLDLKTAGISGLFRCLVDEPITILRGAPSLFRTLSPLPEARAAFSKLRLIHLYGEPVLRADIQELRAILPQDCVIRTTYGATECSGIDWYAGEGGSYDPFREPAGVLMPDTEAHVEAEGRSCAAGEIGELSIRSRYNALGEWQNGQLVSGRLPPDPADPLYRVYNTGDLARWTEDGIFVIVGRRDRMVKINGQRVEPAEIESLLRLNASVAEVEIVATERDGRAQLIAFITARPGAPVGLADEAKAQLRRSLPAFMVPQVFVLDRLPRLPGGKVDQNALRSRVEHAP